MQNEVTLKVLSSDPNLVNKNIATIDNKTKTILNLKDGDSIIIKGKIKVIAKIWPGRPNEEGQGIIRIDLPTREQLDVNIGDYIKISKKE